ncbi:MAG: RNA polymerase factor sigma-54 [bacterium]|nr:RNA polymerase factor sigma-54 [bacterium]MDT8394912.1 RNA polymerase factor sigma-54 [bacterium]
MDLKTQLLMKQTQQLVMTPQLQQAIRLLQLSRMELVEMVQQEMLENPVLDEYALPDNENEVSIDRPDGPETPPENSSDKENEIDISSIPQDVAEWESYLESNQSLPYHVREEQERPPIEAMITRPATLHEHLRWQLQMTRLTEPEVTAGEAIIGHLDDNGYLVSPIDEILDPLGPEVAEAGARVLSVIQEFDPAGVGAKDLSECLLIQIRQAGLEGSLVEKIIRQHLDNVARGDVDRIVRETGEPRSDVLQAVAFLKELEPKPGRPFGGSESIYVTPDAYLFKLGGEWTITLNDDGMPKLQINSYYRELMKFGAKLKPEEREFLLEKIRSASWLIKSIDQRQRTIYRVTKSILEKQLNFFERGIRYLKPMVLRDVADDIGVHESTVSRVTTQKYLHCPQGLFELKFFFNPGIQTLSGEMLASESVRAKIRDVVSVEDNGKPLSDQAISEMLRLEGIDIARRTVAKYREAMNILPSSRRKKLT